MSKVSKYLIYGILIIVALGMIFPMLYMLLLSLKHYPESKSTIFDLVFSDFTLKNYIDAFASDSFARYFLNSALVAISVTIGNVIFCLMTAYAISRRRIWLKPFLFASIIGVLMIPPHVVMIPLYRLMVNFNWIDSYFSLIVPWLVTPFGIFLVKQYLDSIPKEIEDAARIDGANDWYILFKIIMPISKPILTVLAIYTFLSNWNSFLFPFLFTNSADYRTLPIGLAFYLGKQSIDWGHLMAGASISALPILILFLLFQRQIIKGLTAGALKD